MFEKKLESENIQKKVKLRKITEKINFKEEKAKKISEKFNAIKEKIGSTEIKSDNYKLKFFEIGEFNKKLKKLKFEIKDVKKEIPALKLEKQYAIKFVSQNNLKKEKLDSLVKVYESKEKLKIEESANEDMLQIKTIEANDSFESFPEISVQNNNNITLQEKVSTPKFVEVKQEQSDNTKLLNSWKNEDNEAGVEIAYEREDGKSFHFEVSKKEGEEVQVNFLSNTLDNLEIKKLNRETNFKIRG